MKIRSIAALAATACIGAAFVGAPSAEAAAPTFPSAGYALTAAHQVTASFVMPVVLCNAHEDRSASFGLFGPAGGWHASASVYCYHGESQADLEIDRGNGGEGVVGNGIAKAGHTIIVTASGLDTSTPAVSIVDATVHDSELTDHLLGVSAVDVGAFADPVASFTTVTMHASVNSGHPFTSIPHPRHNEIRNGTTLIKTGSPSSAGTHFALDFRHR